MTLFHAVFQQNQSSLLSEENFHGMRRRMVDEFIDTKQKSHMCKGIRRNW